MTEISSNSSYNRLLESRNRQKDNQKPSSKTHARQDNFEQIDEKLNDSLGNTSTQNSSYNNRLNNSSSGIKRREQFKTREEDRSSTAEQPAYPDFYGQNNTETPYTTKSEPLREQMLNLPSDPMAAREALREQYERAKGITGEKAEDFQATPGSREDLASGGINWQEGDGSVENETQTKLRGRLGEIAGNIPDENRPNVGITTKLFDSEKEGAFGRFYTKENQIELYATTKDQQKVSYEDMENTAVHEFGHATGRKNFADENGEYSMTDKNGVSLFERARNLEEKALKMGYSPYETVGGKENAEIYNVFDPLPGTPGNANSNDPATREKYARTSAQEHFADIFTEYSIRPDAFRDKMANMQEYLDTNKPGTPEYEYTKESLSIMKDSYNFMKNKVFSGKEF